MAETKNKSKKSFVSELKVEWNLFWEGIVGDEDEFGIKEAEERERLIGEKLEVLSLDQIKSLTKAMSVDRKKLNQRLEALRKEIDIHTERLESLKLVGGEQDETLRAISELNGLGHSINEQLGKINTRLKLARKREDILKEALKRQQEL